MIREATTEDERRRCLRVHHRANASPLPFPVYAASRLASDRRQRASWWMIEEDGEVVATLLRHDLRFAVGGRVLRGYGLGGVATDPDHRRRGLASRLCAAVHREGEPALLFSAIPPAFYERLGYRVLPAGDAVARDPAALAAGGPRAELVPIRAESHPERLREAWDRAPVRLHRDREGWARSLRDDPTDLFLAIGERGYVRLHHDADELEVVELEVDEPVPVIRALAGLAAAGGLALGGWFEVPTELAAAFDDRGRARTLPMLRPHGELDGSGLRLSSADYF